MFTLQNINASVYKGVMFVQMITKFTSFINNRELHCFITRLAYKLSPSYKYKTKSK